MSGEEKGRADAEGAPTVVVAPPPTFISVEALGEHTRLHSGLCWQCPHGSTGCCASPPGVDWSDIGRIVTLGGRDWLLAQLAAGNLRTGERGLLLKRVANDQGNAGTWPTKCVFHGPTGCTIKPEQRAATCNYYLCDDAFLWGGETQGKREAVQAREAHATLMALFGRWDLEILEQVKRKWKGAPWNAAFLDWVGERYKKLVRRDRIELSNLEGRN
ncbi:MAG TPA: hypothetical protein VK191_08155 [Symbiobacteriaceae bacterium]|nr:hypothetical protein [Symbiobacteriaceae bacterium]